MKRNWLLIGSIALLFLAAVLMVNSANQKQSQSQTSKITPAGPVTEHEHSASPAAPGEILSRPTLKWRPASRALDQHSIRGSSAASRATHTGRRERFPLRSRSYLVTAIAIRALDTRVSTVVSKTIMRPTAMCA